MTMHRREEEANNDLMLKERAAMPNFARSYAQSGRGLAALNPGDLPFTDAVGKKLRVTRAAFEYKGPPIDALVGVALKPSSILPMGFNNGDNIVEPYWAAFVWGLSQAFLDGLPVTGDGYYQVEMTGLVIDLFTVPPPGNYTSRSGAAREFREGTIDTWVWVSDFSAMPAAPTPAEKADESYMLMAVQRDNDVVDLVSPAARTLGVAYALIG